MSTKLCKCVWVQYNLGLKLFCYYYGSKNTHIYMDGIVSGCTYVGAKMPGCNPTWPQNCLGAVLWVQKCLGAVIFGLKGIWAQSYGLKCMGAVLHGRTFNGIVHFKRHFFHLKLSFLP